MEDKVSNEGNYKRFKKGSKREHGNFVHPTFKISASAPGSFEYLMQENVHFP